MKFIHTADMLLDRSFAGDGLPPAVGGECRAHLYQTFLAILGHARTAKADAVLIAGNLIDADRVARGTLNAMREALAAAAPIPVFICPGEADPADADSPWRSEPWPDNVHLFVEPGWSRVDRPEQGFAVHGYAGSGVGESIQPLDGPRVHVGLRHLGRPSGAPPVSPADLALPASLDYLALGGRRDAAQVDVAGTTAWFSGAPEIFEPGTDWDASCLEVDIAPGKPAKVKRVTLSSGRFWAVTLDCTPFTSGQELLDALRDALRAAGDRPLVRITLTGILLRPIYGELDGIRESLATDSRLIQWRDHCEVGDDFTALAGERNALGAFIQRIQSEIQDAPDETVRRRRVRSRDLGLCAFRGTELPVAGLGGLGQ